MIRVAVVYQRDKVWVEWTPEVFVELLETYAKQNNGDIRLAMARIVEELKQKTTTS